MEPQIRSILNNFLSKFKAPEFARGLASIGGALLDILSTLTSVATWVTRNFHWIEPVLFSGFVATRLFKLAGAVTNLGVAFGFLGKQAAASSTIQTISGLTGFASMGSRGMSFANKRALVSAMSAAGISGRGAMTQALGTMGRGGRAALLGRGGMFATQVATGNGLIGAGASLASLGTGAMVATAGVSALVGVMGFLAYKTWKVKQAKDAVQEEINANRKYHYPSIEALHKSLRDTYNQAISAKRAVDDLTAGKTIEEASGQKIGAFTGNWWISAISTMGSGMGRSHYSMTQQPSYTMADARNDDTKNALTTIAKIDGQNSINSAWGEIGKLKSPLEVAAFIQSIPTVYGMSDKHLDKSLWTERDGVITYKQDIGDMPASTAAKTYHYAKYQNETVVPMIEVAATSYYYAISSIEEAQKLMVKGGYDFQRLNTNGFYRDAKGQWAEPSLGKNATDEERQNLLANRIVIRNDLVKFAASQRQTLGGKCRGCGECTESGRFSPLDVFQ